MMYVIDAIDRALDQEIQLIACNFESELVSC